MKIKNRRIDRIIPVAVFLIFIFILSVQVSGCSTTVYIPDTDKGIVAGGPAEDITDGKTNGISSDLQKDGGDGISEVASQNTLIPQDQYIALLPEAITDVESLPAITRYNMGLDIDFAGAAYGGSAEIDYANLEDVSLESLYFRLFPNSGRAYGNGTLEVRSVKVDGQDVETEYSLGDSVMKIKLPEPLQAGERIRINLEFSGKVPQDFGGGGYGIFNLSQDVMCLAGWFPIIPVYDDEGWNIDPSSSIGDSVYTDMAYFDLEVTADDSLEVVSTGSLLYSKNLAGEKKQHKFVSGPARDFVLVLSPDFKTVNKTVQGTEINVHYFKDDEDIAKDTLATAEGCLETFNREFGLYPYSELDLVEVPMNGSIGIEFPGIVLFGSLIFGDTVFTSHEVAHQWWYNIVGNDIYDDPWLDEALTTYSSLIYLEQNPSMPDYQQVLGYFKGEHQKNVNAGGDDIVTEGLDHFEELGGRHYSLVVYVKGALFYDAVRKAIGDDPFYSALENYYQDNKYEIADPEDILDSFEQASGQQLDDLYKEWLYSKD